MVKLVIIYNCVRVDDSYKLYRFQLFIFILSPRGNILTLEKTPNIGVVTCFVLRGGRTLVSFVFLKDDRVAPATSATRPLFPFHLESKGHRSVLLSYRCNLLLSIMITNSLTKLVLFPPPSTPPHSCSPPPCHGFTDLLCLL